MSTCLDSLVVGGVIGEVIDPFVPSISMSINFDSKHLYNGCNIRPSLTSKPPTVNIGGKTCDLYTLVMTDPDAPNPSEPTMREWLHWMVVNIPGGTDLTQGEEMMPYMGPCPPIGIHRHVFVLFRQQNRLAGVWTSTERRNFNTRFFAASHNLGLPVAAQYFNSQKESARNNRRVR